MRKFFELFMRRLGGISALVNIGAEHFCLENGSGPTAMMPGNFDQAGEQNNFFALVASTEACTNVPWLRKSVTSMTRRTGSASKLQTFFCSVKEQMHSSRRFTLSSFAVIICLYNGAHRAAPHLLLLAVLRISITCQFTVRVLQTARMSHHLRTVGQAVRAPALNFSVNTLKSGVGSQMWPIGL